MPASPSCPFGLFGLSGLFGWMKLTRWTRQTWLVPDVRPSKFCYIKMFFRSLLKRKVEFDSAVYRHRSRSQSPGLRAPVSQRVLAISRRTVMHNVR